VHGTGWEIIPVSLMAHDKGAKASIEKPLALRDPGDGRAS